MCDCERLPEVAELTDADLEAVAAGKQRMGLFVGDVLFTAPMVKVGVLPRSALQSRAFQRSPTI